MELGTRIDALYALRATRLLLEKDIDALKKQEAEAKQEIIDALKAANMQGGKGAAATASITYKTKPQVTDWDAVYAFIKKKDMPSLLHKRLTEGLWQSLQDDGIVVPGTEAMTLVDLSLTKVGSK